MLVVASTGKSWPFLWCEVALRGDGACLPRVRAGPSQALRAAAAGQQARLLPSFTLALASLPRRTPGQATKVGAARFESGAQVRIPFYHHLRSVGLHAVSRAPMTSACVQLARFVLPCRACGAPPAIGRQCGQEPPSLQGGLACCGTVFMETCRLLDERCVKLSFDTAFPRRPCLLEHRSLRQQRMPFALYVGCCGRRQVMAFVWCEVAARRWCLSAAGARETLAGIACLCSRAADSSSSFLHVLLFTLLPFGTRRICRGTCRWGRRPMWVTAIDRNHKITKALRQTGSDAGGPLQTGDKAILRGEAQTMDNDTQVVTAIIAMEPLPQRGQGGRVSVHLRVSHGDFNHSLRLSALEGSQGQLSMFGRQVVHQATLAEPWPTLVRVSTFNMSSAKTNAKA